MSIDSISKAYSKINFQERPKQKIITRESLGISINGPGDGTKRQPTALQRMAQGYRDHKKQIEARTKELEKENTQAHNKAMKNLKNNTEKGGMYK